jgi:hypothetical protein
MSNDDKGTNGGAAQAVLERLGALEVGEGVAHDRMVVFPVFADGHQTPDGTRSPLAYRTLQEALADGTVEITERASAAVPELVLANKGLTMVLVLDGEEIVGGRQNRIVNASFLVAAGVTFPLPVSCVEQGRWHEVSRTFTSGESSYHSLKRMKHVQVSASLAAGSGHRTDQGAVWTSVARSAAGLRAPSPSGAMHDIYRSRERDLAAYQQAFPYVTGAVGLIAALNGRMAGADVFDQPRTAEALWPKLVRSYVLDALEGEPGAQVARERALRLLERARAARCEIYPSVALGQDVRIQGDGVVGGGLVYEGTPVHVSLFRTHGEETAAQGSMARASVRRVMSSRPRPEMQRETQPD